MVLGHENETGPHSCSVCGRNGQHESNILMSHLACLNVCAAVCHDEQKGEEWARSLHIALNAIGSALFVW